MTDGVHAFLRNRRDHIVQSWEALVLAESRLVNLSGAVLRNSIPQLLDERASSCLERTRTRSRCSTRAV